MKRVLLVLSLMLSCAGYGFAQAKPYTQMYVFGDSYSDSGAGYVDGNGPTAVVYLAQRMGIPFTYAGDPATKSETPIKEGLNFAVSAAKTDAGEGRRTPGGPLFAYGMVNQVNDFVVLVKTGRVTFDPKQTMFFLLGGLNDRGMAPGTTRIDEEGLIEELYAVGARRFMVALLTKKIPQFASAGEQINDSIAQIPADEKAKHPDIQIATSNWGGFYDEAITNPQKYGFTNVVDKCAERTIKPDGPQPCATPDTYFFYHDGHPSTAAHKVVGDMLYNEAMSQQQQ